MKILEELDTEAHTRLVSKLAEVGQQALAESPDKRREQLFHAFNQLVKVSKDDLKGLTKDLIESVDVAVPLSQQVKKLVEELPHAETLVWLKNAIEDALKHKLKAQIVDAFNVSPLNSVFVLNWQAESDSDSDSEEESEAETESDSVSDSESNSSDSKRQRVDN